VLREVGNSVATLAISSGTICYYDRGRGTPVVLIHGMFGDFLDWEPVLDPLAENQRVIALDLPGFGASSKPRREYSGEFFVATLHEFLGQLEIRTCILAGNSFGGQLAMLYALAYPEAVSRLLLVNSGGFKQYSPVEKSLTEMRFTEPILAALTPQIAAMLFGNVFTKPSEMSGRYVAKQVAKLQRPDYPDYAHAIASSVRLSLSTCLLDRLPGERVTYLSSQRQQSASEIRVFDARKKRDSPRTEHTVCRPKKDGAFSTIPDGSSATLTLSVREGLPVRTKPLARRTLPRG